MAEYEYKIELLGKTLPAVFITKDEAVEFVRNEIIDYLCILKKVNRQTGKTTSIVLSNKVATLYPETINL